MTLIDGREKSTYTGSSDYACPASWPSSFSTIRRLSASILAVLQKSTAPGLAANAAVPLHPCFHSPHIPGKRTSLRSLAHKSYMSFHMSESPTAMSMDQSAKMLTTSIFNLGREIRMERMSLTNTRSLASLAFTRRDSWRWERFGRAPKDARIAQGECQAPGLWGSQMRRCVSGAEMSANDSMKLDLEGWVHAS